ncbi:MAG: CBS domain-containing protein [Bdellovibrionota bacterium]
MNRSSVKQQMTGKLVTISWDLPISDASDLMDERGFRHLPVIDDLGVVVGIISDRDVNRAMNPANSGFMPEATVNDYMSWPVITVDQNLPLKDAAQGMIDQKISAFLVTDESKAVVGIVTSEDMLKALVGMLSKPSSFAKLGYSPVVRELLREAQTSGI